MLKGFWSINKVCLLSYTLLHKNQQNSEEKDRMMEIQDRAAYMQERITDIHCQTTEIRARLPDVHCRTTDIHRQTTEIWDRIPGIQSRAADIHGQMTEIGTRIPEIQGLATHIQSDFRKYIEGISCYAIYWICADVYFVDKECQELANWISTLVFYTRQDETSAKWTPGTGS
jgi:hypothetical protein